MKDEKIDQLLDSRADVYVTTVDGLVRGIEILSRPHPAHQYFPQLHAYTLLANEDES